MRLDLLQRIHELCTRLEPVAHVPPPQESLAVVIAGAVCGSARPEVAESLVDANLGFEIDAEHLVLQESNPTFEARTQVLQSAAQWLLDHGLIRGWRNETLAVVADLKQPPVARIERAACRALGLPTFAVHLNAWSNGELWLSRRAAHKTIDPGLWDSLVGGMVTANESERVALDREAYEEAGLVMSRYAPQAFRRVHVWRPVPEGYQSEVIRMFDVELPAQVKLVNHDGEVDLIERRDVEALLDAMEAGALTLEAMLATLESLTRQTGFDMGRELYIG